MAEVKLYQNDEGQLLARLPGSVDYVPVTPDQVAILEESGPEAFIRAANNTIEQYGTGARALVAGALGANQTEAEAMEKLQGLRGNQELRGAGSPIAGSVGSFAPDVALGGLTGGIGPVAGRIAATGALEGALGAARNPEDPLRGAAIQGTIGAALMGAGPVASGIGRRVHPYTSRVTGAIDDVIRRTRGADDAAPPGVYRSASGKTGMASGSAERATGGPLSRAGGLTPETGAQPAGAEISRGLTPEDLTTGQMRGQGATMADDVVDRWNTPISEDQARMLNATSDAEFEEAAMNLQESQVRSRTGSVLSRLWNGQPTDHGALDIAQKREIRRNLASEIGQPQAQRLDRNTIGENLERISGDISELINQSGPVRSGSFIEAWKALDQNFGEGPAGVYVRRLVRQAEEKAKGPGQVMSAKDAAELRNRIGTMMEKMGKNEPDLEGVEVLGSARDALDRELKAKWTPEMQEDFEQLGYQWKLSQALIRGAKGALSDENELNLSQFMNNWRMLDNSVRTGRARDNEFLQYMQAMTMIRHQRVPNSGTPTGIAAGLARMGEDWALGALGPVGSVLR